MSGTEPLIKKEKVKVKKEKPKEESKSKDGKGQMIIYTGGYENFGYQFAEKNKDDDYHFINKKK